jgi:hypothetical protein
VDEFVAGIDVEVGMAIERLDPGINRYTIIRLLDPHLIFIISVLKADNAAENMQPSEPDSPDDKTLSTPPYL